MKTGNKRFISLLLAFILIVGMLPPMEAYAEVVSGSCGDNVTWNLSVNGTLIISGEGPMKDYGATETTPWPKSGIIRVDIYEGVTHVGNNAFYGMHDLLIVNMADTVTSIGKNAFAYCYKLLSMNIPDSVKSIGNYAFEYCLELPGIILPSGVTLGSGLFYDCPSMQYIYFQGDAPTLTDKFYNKALAGITSAYIYYPAGNATWTDAVREACGGTPNWRARNGFEFEKQYCEYCDKGWILDEGFVLTVIGSGQMLCSHLKEIPKPLVHNVKLTERITTVVDLNNCVNLKSVYMPDSVTVIGDYAFNNCVSLREVTMSNQVTILGSRAFGDCRSLSHITLPETLSTIGNYAFYNNSAMHQIEIPASVDRIWSFAFSGCTLMDTIKFRGNAPSLLDTGIFAGLKYTTVYYPTPSRNWGEEKRQNYGGQVTWTPYEVEHVHEYEEIEFVSPDCERDGYAVYRCYCGEEDRVTQPAVGHEIVMEWIEPTCTSVGYNNNTCTRCGFATVSDEVPPQDHDWSAWEEIPGFNCLSMGMKRRSCYKCGTSEEVETEHGPHQISYLTKEPTCTEPGDARYYCGICHYTEIVDTPPALGHEWSEWRTFFDGGCTNPSTEERRCTRCSLTENREIPAAGHSYQQTIVAPTCTEGGYTLWTCRCGSSYTDSATNPLGHNMQPWHETVQPGCEREGEESRNCSRCSYTESRAVQSAGHSWNDWQVVRNATEDMEGLEQRNCFGCGKYESRSIPKLDHVHKYESEVYAPTCTSRGYTTHTCTKCGYSYNSSYVDALGHNWNKGTVIKEATCTIDGEILKTCQRCGTKTTEYIWSEGHSFARTLVEPTCTENGYRKYVCSVCGFTYRLQYQSELTTMFQNALNLVAGSGVFSYNAEFMASRIVNLYRTENDAQYITVSAKEFEDRLNAYFVFEPEVLEQIRNFGEYAELYGPDLVVYDSQSNTYTLRLWGGFGGWMDERVYVGYVDKGETYDVFYGKANYLFLSEVLPQGVDVWSYWEQHAEGYPETLVYDGMTYSNGPDGPYTIFSIDPAGKLATVELNDDIVRIISVTDYALEDMPESFDDDYGLATGHKWDEGKVTKEPTETVEGVKTYTCTACGETRTQTIPTIEHVHQYEAKVTAPTCLEKGYTTHTCKCGDSYVTDETDALGHAMGAWTVTKNATCTAKGEEQRSCTRCGHTEKRETAAIGHAYEAAVTAPTCTAEGYTTHTCANCGDSYVDSKTSALGHKWDNGKVTKEPTETTEGEKILTCTVCGTTKVEKIPTTDHVHQYEAKVTAPTCTEKGYTTHTCKCGDSYVTDETAALGHAMGAWMVTKNATCTAKGEEQRGCTRCGHTEKRETAAIGHDYEATVTAPTCTAEGYTTHTCANCGDSYVDSKTSALGHKWDNGKVTKEPTETTEGEKLYTCTVCGTARTEKIPTKEHVHAYASVVTEPTCTEGGYTTHTCACGDSYITDETKALGHKMGAWVVTKEPTDTETGLETRTCERCGHREERTVAVVENPFTDVPENKWYTEPVLWAVEKGITTGTAADEFSPDEFCTRAQIVTFLWRANGSPEPESTKNPFTDVKTSKYYYKAVLWAVEKGITTGTSADKFSPDEVCTRAQVATFLWRAAGKPEMNGYDNPFTDVEEDDYCYVPVLWAVEHGITVGTGHGKFSPKDECTRSQIVTFLYRAVVEQ